MAKLNTNLTDLWDKSKSYQSGQVVMKDKALYYASKSISANTEWSADDWNICYLADLLRGHVNSNVNEQAPELLWENSDPTAAFAAQTVALDLSGYAGVIVELRAKSADDSMATRTYVKIGETIGSGFTDNSVPTCDTRDVSASTTGVTFGTQYYTGKATGNGSALIPTKIYGVKHVVTESTMEDAPELLWSNPSPASPFAGQKVSVDFSNYSGAIIEYKRTYDATAEPIIASRIYVKKGDVLVGTGNEMFGAGYLSNTSAPRGRAIISFDDTGITFGNAYGPSDTNADLLVPLNIYGVKRAVVEVETNAPDLLWVNSTPTSDFNAQTVSLDLTNYDGVLVEMYQGKTVLDVVSRVYCKKNDDISSTFGGGYCGTVSGLGRSFTISDTGVTFSVCKASGDTMNSELIPSKIYGVKGAIAEITEGKDAIIEAVNDKGGELESTASTLDIVDAISNLGGSGNFDVAVLIWGNADASYLISNGEFIVHANSLEDGIGNLLEIRNGHNVIARKTCKYTKYTSNGLETGIAQADDIIYTLPNGHANSIVTASDV